MRRSGVTSFKLNWLIITEWRGSILRLTGWCLLLRPPFLGAYIFHTNAQNRVTSHSQPKIMGMP